MTVLLAEATVAVSCHFGCRKPQCLNALSHSALFYSLDVGIRRYLSYRTSPLFGLAMKLYYSVSHIVARNANGPGQIFYFQP
jgi:hypothetical protein